MTGYELITPTPTNPPINNENELATNKEIDDNGYYKEYIPDNTRVRLLEVMQKMTPHLKQEQIILLAKTLSHIFNNIECIPCQRSGDPKKHNRYIIQEFLTSKRVEGCSPRTIEAYGGNIKEIAEFLEKKGALLVDMETQDMRDFIAMKMEDGVGPVTCDTYRRIASTFFRWARNEHYTTFSPVDAVKPVKRKKKLKEPFKQIELLKIRNNCKRVRDRAIVELLLCSGIRVSELHNMKISDVDFHNMEFKVLGKGNKERVCYLNDVAVHYIKEYLGERGEDNCPYLWVQVKRYNGEARPWGIHGIERMIRDTGKRAGVDKCHPHRFRHTFATNALNKGIPIEQVQILLGHEKLDTTMIYAKVAREDVKFNHHKLLN